MSDTCRFEKRPFASRHGRWSCETHPYVIDWFQLAFSLREEICLIKLIISAIVANQDSSTHADSMSSPILQLFFSWLLETNMRASAILVDSHCNWSCTSTILYRVIIPCAQQICSRIVVCSQELLSLLFINTLLLNSITLNQIWGHWVPSMLWN